jgi:hypothetical protein
MAQVNVLTYHYDNLRTGLNSAETVLTPANVNPSSFGLLFKLPVDGAVYGQPLYVTGVTIPGKGVHNVLYVVTENNSVYAFDATSNTGANSKPLWKVNLGPAVPYADVGVGDIQPLVGITATPVIHLTGPGAGFIYVLAKTKESDGAGGYVYVQRLHALYITTGTEPQVGPKVIQATVNGVGDGNDGKGHISFNPLIQNNRPGLLYFSNGTTNLVVLAWASHGDNGPYHGWIMAYDPSSLRQVSVLNTTPNATSAAGGSYPLAAGGIWQSGAAPASDGTSIYLSTGNGLFDPSTQAYGDSVLKLSPTLSVLDYFAPYTQESLNLNDGDLGSGGVMLIPNDPVYNPTASLMVQAGKDGTLHILNTANLGQYNASGPDHIWGEFPEVMPNGIWGSPAYFRGTIYYGPQFEPLSTFKISGSAFVGKGIVSTSANNFAYPGPTPSVSSNGNANGIVWAVDSSAFVGSGSSNSAQLWAYDATNVGTTLYSSANTGNRDRMGPAVKFVTPLVDGGQVYVGTEDEVDVFGLGHFCQNPVINTASGSYPTSISVTVTDSTPTAKMYYTLDGSKPTQSSTLYTGPISISTDAVLSIQAFSPNLYPSGVQTATYLIEPTVGTGTGLTGSYYSNMTLSGTPTVVEVDPTIQFDWAGNSPVKGVPGQSWSATWTGEIQALGTGNYTFYTMSNDGVQLFINGNEIINDWTDHPATEDVSAPVPMVAGQKYTIQIQYYQYNKGSELELFWSSLGLPVQIVPQTQLYPH